MENTVKIKNNKAFTLAEVLITIGIIGVVAAMTIPTLLANYKAKKMRTQLLRANSIIQQAAMHAKADEIDLDEVINQKKYEEVITGQCGGCTRRL